MTDHAQSTSSTITSLSPRVRARLATAMVAALAVIALVWALLEESRLPDAQKSELFTVISQAYP
jgi:hypothetical protein